MFAESGGPAVRNVRPKQLRGDCTGDAGIPGDCGLLHQRRDGKCYPLSFSSLTLFLFLSLCTGDAGIHRDCRLLHQRRHGKCYPLSFSSLTLSLFLSLCTGDAGIPRDCGLLHQRRNGNLSLSPLLLPLSLFLSISKNKNHVQSLFYIDVLLSIYITLPASHLRPHMAQKVAELTENSLQHLCVQVLKVAVLAEKYATDYKWYVDVILNLIRLAGDYVSEEVRI